MKHRIYLPLLAALFFACQSDPIADKPEPAEKEISVNESVEQGVIRIKLKASAGRNMPAGASGIDRMARSLGVVKMERTFPHAGKFEKMQQKAGLHLWYDLYFDRSLPVTRALADFKNSPDIDVAEPIQQIIRIGGNPIAVAGPNSSPAAEANTPFNDPHLSLQWHYYNDGSISRSSAGCDINVFPAWKITGGHPDVIVAIVDGGIDTGHEDLKENIWVNQSEENGNPNEDDDENGYRGDINGWNFVDNTPLIIPHAHGTHVAGTVAAVNNNGKGVAGVAGGTGQQDGVKVVSCQIFKQDPADPSKDLTAGSRLPAAIAYGVFAGAVISQNSWGHPWDGQGTPPVLNQAIKEAIDFFIDNAGKDEDGNQLPDSPMKGGIVIFSAGNDERGYRAYPAAYERVVAVSAMATDFRKAYYANWGTWVDVTAPGGDAKYGTKNQVYSTTPGNKYGYMQGTSMACPHVSGIAALMVAKFGAGKPGLTAEMLRTKLQNSVHDINPHVGLLYAGQMGYGYIDAALALAEDRGMAPEPVTDISALWSAVSLNLQWSVTRDEDNGTAFQYELFLETSPITTENIGSLTPQKTVEVGNLLSGQPLQTTVNGLTPETHYYLAVVGVDLFGNRSEPCFLNGNTTNNGAPVVEMEPVVDPILLKAHETRKFRFRVQDPEEDSWSVEMENPRAELAVAKEGKHVFYLQIEAPEASPGQYTATLNIVDEPGAVTRILLAYEIEANHPPRIIKPLDSLYFTSIGASQTVDLSDYFTDEDGESLTYTFTPSQQGQAVTSVDNNILTVKALRAGKITVTVTAADFAGEEAAGSFVLMARDGRQEVDLYPNPVRERLYIRMGLDVSGEVHVKLYSGGGALVLEQKAAISPFEPAVLDV
ncbi:MAG: S8 family serine peptidase, partial [Culturomica sp.]|nr:S8 family serine peptidase [Culturomica sp.]